MPSDSIIAQQLRNALEALSESKDTDPRLRDVVDDILAGRRNATDLLSAPGIEQAVSHGMLMYRQRESELSSEERRERDKAARVRGEELSCSDPLARGILLGEIPVDE